MATPIRRRLDHIDAMRPIKQAGVVTTHSVIFFAPAAASTGSGAALLLLHASREGFFFISACMLAYSYAELKLTDRAGLRHFYWRRILAVGVPYLCWNLIYFLFLLPAAHYASVTKALGGLGHELEFGYFQLYFLVVIMQFYVVAPLVIVLLRRTRGHHGLVLAAAVLAQLAMAVLTQLHLLPGLMQKDNQEDALSYLTYLIGGCIVAFHLEQVDAWVRAHARLILTATAAAALAVEALYFLAKSGVSDALGPYFADLATGYSFSLPTVIPFNVGIIACGYLAGIALVRPGRSRLARAIARTGADDAYGIYLSHMLVLQSLVWLGWGTVATVIPWPAACLLAVALVALLCVPLTEFLARTPLAVALTGRKRVPWHRPPEPAPLPLPRPAAPGPTVASTAAEAA